MRASIGDLRACADTHLARYLDPDHPSPRAFGAYDAPADLSPNRLTPLDVLAPVLLSVRMTYGEVLPMFASTGPSNCPTDPHQVLGTTGVSQATASDPSASRVGGPLAGLPDRPWGNGASITELPAAAHF